MRGGPFRSMKPRAAKGDAGCKTSSLESTKANCDTSSEGARATGSVAASIETLHGLCSSVGQHRDSQDRLQVHARARAPACARARPKTISSARMRRT